MITLLDSGKNSSWSFDYRRTVRVTVESSEPIDVYVSDDQKIEGRTEGLKKAIFARQDVKFVRETIKLPYSWWWKKGKWLITVGNISGKLSAVYCYVSVWL